MTSYGEGSADRHAWPVAPHVAAPAGPAPAQDPPTSEIPVVPPPPVPVPPVPVTSPAPPQWRPEPVGPRRRPAGWMLVAAVAAFVVLAGSGTAIWLAHGRGGRAAAVPSASGVVGERPDPGRPAEPSAGTSPDPSTGGLAGSSAAPSGPAADPNLVADDEFSGTAPDPAKWGVYQSTAENGSAWLRSQVRVGDGELRIVGAGRNPTGKGNVAGGLCWCGPGGDRLYGIWEVRARFDAGAGYGPVVGLYPQGDQTANGSLAFASFPEGDRHTLHGYVLWPTGPTGRTVTGDFTTWHTYRVEWRSTFVKMSVDGRPFFDSTATAPAVAVPRGPMHLFIQVTVGPKNGVPAPGAATPDQVVTHLDWARAYR